jgi:hypothetical protein
MKLGMSRSLARSLVGCLAALAALASAVRAAPVPAKVELSNLRAIQVNNTEKGDDNVYVVVQGVAKGADVQKRVPETGALKANPKKPAVSDKEPVTLWQGELDDGEYALLTVAVFQGEGTDAAKLKAFQDQVAEAGKAERSKKTITTADAKPLAAATVKAQQEVVKKVKDTFAREKKTDHYGGLFNVLVWNDNGKIAKRLDPVGLTFGEHYGTDAKIYTKLKYTRNNVFEQDPDNKEWYETQYGPLNDDEDAVRVKMLETEYIKTPEGDANKKVTDYLADIKVYSGDKPLKWATGGEHPGPGTLHTWWEFAE